MNFEYYNSPPLVLEVTCPTLDVPLVIRGTNILFLHTLSFCFQFSTLFIYIKGASNHLFPEKLKDKKLCIKSNSLPLRFPLIIISLTLKPYLVKTKKGKVKSTKHMQDQKYHSWDMRCLQTHY